MNNTTIMNSFNSDNSIIANIKTQLTQQDQFLHLNQFYIYRRFLRLIYKNEKKTVIKVIYYLVVYNFIITYV